MSGSIYNRLQRPIAVIGRRDAYQHLCYHCNLDASNNDVFHHVSSYETAVCKEFSRVIEVGDPEWIRDNVRDYSTIVSLTKSMIRN